MAEKYKGRLSQFVSACVSRPLIINGKRLYLLSLITKFRMIRTFFLVFSIALFFLTSCVPNKRLVYLQHGKEPKRGTVINGDTAVRSYKPGFTEYKLKPKDIITIRVASITPADFDFVQKYEEQLGLIRKLHQYELSNLGGGTNSRSSTGISAGAGSTSGGAINPLSLDRMQSGFVLDDSARLDLPRIGKVYLGGLTLPQAERLVESKLLGYFETPIVRIQILNFHFTILGEVNNEGRYTIFDPNANIIDAIALAGNLTDFADRSTIKIIRTDNNNTTATVFYVNLLQEDLLAQPGYYLRPNDVLVVAPLPVRTTRKYTLPNYTTALSLITTTLTLVILLSGNN
jgi:polysaccharide biosynthesis/export protein